MLSIILGTSRKGRQSEWVAVEVLRLATEAGVESRLIDVRDFADPLSGRVTDGNETAKRWVEIVNTTDNFIIVSPEYNHGYPGELKLLLDRASRADYVGKPTGIVAVSSGPYGGARMIEHLNSVLLNLSISPDFQPVLISLVEQAATPEGRFKNEQTSNKITQLIQRLSRTKVK